MIDPRLYDNPINILVRYNEIFRDHNFFLLKLIMDNPNLKKQFEKYVSFERFECQTDERIKVLLLNREKKNILEWLAFKKFDYELNYRKLYYKFLTMFEESPVLDIYSAIVNLVHEDFVKQIFVYGDRRDKRVMFDLSRTFINNKKIHYVTGPYMEIVSTINKIDLFIDNDIERIAPLMFMEKYYPSTFMIAKYGYNYNIISGRPMLKGNIISNAIKKKINLVEFYPFDIKYEHTING